jgi:hypothetical protein
MSTESTPVNNEIPDSFGEKITKASMTIAKNMAKQNFTIPEVAAVGAMLMAGAFLEISEEDEHPRDVFMGAMGMLDTAFAVVEDSMEEDEGEAPNENAR